jgi:uncharacterized protein YdeI (YjbR/CyaY-like superfamily)
MKGNKSADEFIQDNPYWQNELNMLREIFLRTGLCETIKWGIPVYVYNNKNVAGMAAFKSYVGIWFYQGALLKDSQRKLINAQEGVTKALRQWRFSGSSQISEEAETIMEYVNEAVGNLVGGVEIKSVRNAYLVIPEELLKAFDTDPGLKECFDALSHSRKRDYIEYLNSAKREETKLNRLNKIKPMILRGEGLNDKYSR